ncbi:phytanoyl-CoA dioxygenase family protein [Chloroflexi bacterium TSY]|nr:phytanoyl-CoA dioxygenase family protein [Chloroflexi bacterium TSY]
MEYFLPNENDITDYRENGYWISSKLFSNEELKKFCQHHARVIDGEYETGRTPDSRIPQSGKSEVVQVLNAHWSDVTIAQLVLDVRIGAIAARLAGVSGIRLFHDQLIYKPPHSGDVGQIGWHQDLGYWTCIDDDRTLTAWVALEDVTEEKGPMEVVPGSHKWGILDENHFRDLDLDEQIRRIEAKSGRPFKTELCTMAAGCVSFHNGATIHGSRANLSDHPRLSAIVHMIPDGACYRAGTSADKNSYNKWIQADGDPYAGPYFPVIYREGDELANVWAVGKR